MSLCHSVNSGVCGLFQLRRISLIATIKPVTVSPNSALVRPGGIRDLAPDLAFFYNHSSRCQTFSLAMISQCLWTLRILNHLDFMMKSQFLTQLRLGRDDLGSLAALSIYLTFCFSQHSFRYRHLTLPCDQRSRKKRFTDRHSLRGFASIGLLSRSSWTHLSKHIKISSRAGRIDCSRRWSWGCMSVNSVCVKDLTVTNGISSVNTERPLR